MNDILIKDMEVHEVDQVMEVELQCFKTPWSKDSFIHEIENNKFAKYIVAIDQTEIIGYVGIWYVLDEGSITNVAVRKDYRRKGIANQLVTHILEDAKGKNIQKIFLEVRESNDSAKTLYERHGFEAIGIRKAYYKDNNEDAILMICHME